MIKPRWALALAHEVDFAPPQSLPNDVIVSDERLGDFLLYPPAEVARRLSLVCPDGGVVVFIQRDPVALFYSSFRQALWNDVMRFAAETESGLKARAIMTMKGFFNTHLVQYRKRDRGFFAIIDIEKVRTAFQRYFDFHTINFELLKTSPQTFVSKFSSLCDATAELPISHANESSLVAITTALDRVQHVLSPHVRAQIIDLYTLSRLSSDREDFIRNWPASSAVADAFTGAFRFT